MGKTGWQKSWPLCISKFSLYFRNRGASGLVQTNPSIPLHKWPVVYTERQIDRLINFPFLTFRLASKINFYDYLHAVLQVVHDLKLSFSHPLHPPTRNFIIYLFCNMCGMGSVFLTILSSISRFTFKLCDMGDCLPWWVAQPQPITVDIFGLPGIYSIVRKGHKKD